LSVVQVVDLIRGSTGESVEASLVQMGAKHVEQFDLLWGELLLEFEELDARLSWRFKQQLADRNANYECYALECEGLIQGLLMLETQNRWSLFDRGQRLVYVEVIMTAPWNRESIQRPPEWRGVGTALMLFVRQRSRDLGYQGCVGLKSLPGAEVFYERRGMTRLELEPEDIVDPEEKLPYFEYRAPRRRTWEDDDDD
jgi:GNAT superfamily N-acetyltransferase